MGDAGGEHPRLAGAGSGQHEQRPVKCLDRLALLGIERIEIMAGTEPHGPLRRRNLLLIGRGQGFGGRGAILRH